MSVGAFQNSALRTGQPARRRPRWPYTVNTDNWQADGLILCPGFNIAAGNNQTLYDLTEGKRHGTLGGSPIWTHDPQIGECLYFGGSQARRVTWGAVFPSLTAATIVLLLRNFGNNNGAPISFNSDGSFCSHYPFAGTDEGNNLFLSTLHSTRQNFNDDSNFKKKAWHLLAVTSVAGSVANGWRVFQNGRRIGLATSPSSISFNSSRRSIGQSDHGDTGCQTWSGFIGDFRLYNRALSDAEIAAITLENFTDVYYEIGRRTIFLPAQAVALAGDAKGKATANQSPLGLLEAGRTAGRATTGQTPFGLLGSGRTAGRSRSELTQTQLRLSLSNHYAARVLATPNLELYYRMNEPSGTTVKDYAPRGLDGTSSGLTLNQPGVTFGGKAISPSDDASYIRRASSDVFANITTEWSFEFWLNLDDASQQETHLNLFGQPLDDSGVGLGSTWLYLNWESSATPPIYDGFDVYTRNGTAQQLYSHAVFPKLPRAEWLHIVMRINYTTLEQAVFINGVEQTLQYDFFDSVPGEKINSPNNANDFYIFHGRQLDNTTPNSFGNPVCQISEFAIYSRALTDAEITAHYTAAINPATIQGRSRTLLSVLEAFGFVYSTGRSTATGTLTTAVGLNGLSTGRNRTRGDLLLSLAFAGSTFGRGRIPSASLSLSFALSGIVRANSSAKANVLSLQIPLAGQVMGNGRVLPALDEWRVYAGPRHVRSFTVKIRDSRTFKV